MALPSLYDRLVELKGLHFSVEMSIAHFSLKNTPIIKSQVIASSNTYSFYSHLYREMLKSNECYDKFNSEALLLINQLKDSLNVQPNEQYQLDISVLKMIRYIAVKKSKEQRRELDEEGERISSLLVEGMRIHGDVIDVLQEEEELIESQQLHIRENYQKKIAALEFVKKIVLNTISTDPRLKELFEKTSVEEFQKIISRWQEKFIENLNKYLQTFWKAYDGKETNYNLIEKLQQKKVKMEEMHQLELKNLEKKVQYKEARIAVLEKNLKELEEKETNADLIQKRNDKMLLDIERKRLRIDDLIEENEELEKSQHKMTTDLGSMKMSNAELIEENNELKMDLKEMRKIWRMSGTLMNTIMEENMEEKNQKKRIDEETERNSQELHIKLNKMESDFEFIRCENVSYKRKLEAAFETVNYLKATLEESKARCDTLDGQLLEANDLHEWAESAFEKMRKEKEKDEKMISMLRNMSIELDKEKSQIKEKYEKDHKEDLKKIEILEQQLKFIEKSMEFQSSEFQMKMERMERKLVEKEEKIQDFRNNRK